ncbi:MAG: restriction endonuclease subunit S [Ruminococcus sp.]|nr:restriction endonuclease subunit S [Ruminococcus sp.]MDD5889025.1 restriction endonuclease subunit S [Ruminococcus sp.]
MAMMKNTGMLWIGQIPVDWELGKVKYAFNRKKEKSTAKDPIVLSLARAGVRIRDISTNEGQLAASYEGYNPVEPNDLLLNPMDLVSGANCSISKVSGVISPAYVNLRAKTGFEPRYYDYYFKTQYWNMGFFVHGKGVSFENRWTLNDATLKDYYIPMPSLSEQQAIADYLDETCSQIDEIIAEAKASIDEYKELKQSVITEAVLHGFEEKSVKHSSIEWIGDYNAEFGMTRIGRFCFVTKLAGFEYTNAMTDSIVNEFGVPIVRAQNVKMFKFYSDKIREFIPKDISFQLNRSSLNKKCLLITFIGAGIGDVCVFYEKERYHLAPNVAKIEIFDEYKCLLDEHYLMYYLGSEAGQGEIRRISKASAQPSLSMETIRSINVVLPPFDVQEQIVEYLNKKMLHMDSLIAEKESLINDLEAYKKSLIYEVVTGKRRVV